MRKLKVNSADCSSNRLVIIARRCGFIVKGGAKHYKVKTKNGEFVTIIPRHNRLKRETVRGVVKTLNQFDCDIDLN